MVQPDTSNPFPVITGSPALANGMVYVSMTSNEEFAAGLDAMGRATRRWHDRRCNRRMECPHATAE
jgi:hypothetical protein